MTTFNPINGFKLYRLTIEQIRQIYREHLIFDFPESEVKPLAMIEEGYHNQSYEGYGFFDDDHKLYSYAFFIRDTQSPIALLDYFAVTRGNRSSGIGGCMLQKLDQLYAEKKQRILLEVENPDQPAELEAKAVMERRIRFYTHNCVHMSNVTCCFEGNEYRIMYCGEQLSDTQVQQMIIQLYTNFFGMKFFKKKVHFYS